VGGEVQRHGNRATSVSGGATGRGERGEHPASLEGTQIIPIASFFLWSLSEPFVLELSLAFLEIVGLLETQALGFEPPSLIRVPRVGVWGGLLGGETQNGENVGEGWLLPYSTALPSSALPLILPFLPTTDLPTTGCMT